MHFQREPNISHYGVQCKGVTALLGSRLHLQARIAWRATPRRIHRSGRCDGGDINSMFSRLEYTCVYSLLVPDVPGQPHGALHTLRFHTGFINGDADFSPAETMLVVVVLVEVVSTSIAIPDRARCTRRNQNRIWKQTGFTLRVRVRHHSSAERLVAMLHVCLYHRHQYSLPCSRSGPAQPTNRQRQRSLSSANHIISNPFGDSSTVSMRDACFDDDGQHRRLERERRQRERRRWRPGTMT